MNMNHRVKPTRRGLIIGGASAFAGLSLVTTQSATTGAETEAAALPWPQRRQQIEKGWLDLHKTMEECLLSIARAGADVIISYYAKTYAERSLRH